ncbi:hypothetical protein Patl1_33836 [Pistacia atlantica]|uniref:Uncharacterized protein n=1 Tax=Pistacia atlantica TaxID=434234 RepID=A0ACC0ZQT0_9ROSI|nr:hypothetical protein Patl1_33836 [Pistacia atlantica]
MASKFSINKFLLISKRSYAVAVENVRVVQPPAASVVTRKMKEVSCMEKKEVFWMRDPKTGNWIPETHFNQTDVAELRDKFLPHNNCQQA